MPAKKSTSSSKKSSKPSAKVKDLTAKSGTASKTKGGAFKQGFPVKWAG